jgi:hypothetical protein
MLTHLPVNGADGAWARDAAVEAYGGDVDVAEPARTYEV